MAPVILALAAPIAVQPAEQRDRLAAWQARRDGHLLSIKDIEPRVIPTMKGAQYLGFELDMPSGIYTLKFLRDGAVIWVDVDGRTGRIIGRTGR